jgi:hypothetical protein
MLVRRRLDVFPSFLKTAQFMGGSIQKKYLKILVLKLLNQQALYLVAQILPLPKSSERCVGEVLPAVPAPFAGATARRDSSASAIAC